MLSILIAAALGLGQQAGGGQTGSIAPLPFKEYKRPVVTWIPPYAVAKSRRALEDAGALNSLTHLDLQFWQPTKTGGVELVHEPEVTEDAVKSIRDWAHKHKVRVMLCVFNGENKWDWPLAKAAFADNREALVRNLVQTVGKFDLDGVDVDLEGPGSFDADKGAYLQFVTSLVNDLSFIRKQTTVDSFSYIWNAPNQNWWPDLFKVVDGITTMGYEECGSIAPEWRSYAAQEKAAGANAAKLQIGVTGDRNNWQGSTAMQQLNWIWQDGGCGTAIWDAQLNGSAWKTPQIWQMLQAIREGRH